MYYAGVDIGGTTIKAGIVDESGNVSIKSSISPHKSFDPYVITDDIAAQIKSLCASAGINPQDIAGIGVGVPGVVNSTDGVVEYNNNLNWKRFPLAAELSLRTGVKVKISNDANVAALGEARFGAGKNYRDSVLLTLGTGVGGGVVIDGKLFEGFGGFGAELGHMVIRAGGRRCTCGRRGCLEAYASATALISDTKRAMEKNKDSAMWDYSPALENVSGLTAFECAKKGDKTAQIVVDDYIEALGEGIVNIINVFRPQVIMLGGGVSGQGEYIVKPLKKIAKENSYGGELIPISDITIATRGGDAGIIGAASLVMED
jgi:glucokinase